MKINKLTTFAVVALLVLTLFAPLTLQSQLLTNVYYLNVEQGKYYAVNTGGIPYRVFYIDNSGNLVYINAYWWDANPNYVIFQAPFTGRIYIRQENYVLTTLDTKAWVIKPSVSSVDIKYSILDGSNNEVGYIIYSMSLTNANWVLNVKTYTFNGSHLVYDAILQSNTLTQDFTTYPTPTTVGGSSKFVFTLLTSNFNFTSFTPTYVAGSSTYTPGVICSYIIYGNTYYYYIKVSLSSSSTTSYTYTYVGSSSTTTLPNPFKQRISASFSTKSTGYLVVSNNVLTTPNGNIIYVINDIRSLTFYPALAFSSTYSYYLYTQDITITFSQTRTVNKVLVIPINFSNVNIVNPNPAVYIPSLSAWFYAYFVNYGKSEGFIVFPITQIPNVLTLSVKLVYNYPIQYSMPPLNYLYREKSGVVSVFAVNGNITVLNDYVVISGNITLGNYLGSTILIRYDASNSNFTVLNSEYGYIGNYLMIYVNDVNGLIRGSIRVYSVLVLYNTYCEKDYSVSISNIDLQAFTMDRISYTLQGEIVGSWSYRVPIYITLSELPSYLSETGFVFRLELPLQDWVKAGLLSPALEDLIITDSNSRPLPFYVLNATRGVVYVRYTNPIYSSSIVIYVLLKNTQLWGTGNSFSTLNTFDAVYPKDFVDDFGYNVYYSYLSYNAMAVITSKETTLKFGKTWFDFVAFNSSKFWEQHGSTIFYNTSLNNIFKENDELLIYINRQNFDDVLVYKGFSPLFSFRLSNYASNPVYYIGYKDAKSVYVFRMLMYSYSVGQLVGGYQRPQEIQKPQQQIATPQMQVDWFSIFMTMMVLVVLGLVIKWVSTPSAGERKPITLP